MAVGRVRRSRIVAALVVGVALTLAACSSSNSSSGGSSGGPVSSSTPFDQVEALAKKEGTVTWYSGASPAQLQPTANAFTQKYGIQVNLVRITTGQLTTRYSSEAQSGKVVADVVMESDQTFSEKAGTSKWTVPLTPALLPGLKAWPASLVHGSYVSIESIPWGIDYVTTKVPTAPTSYQDLLQPQFKGKILLTVPRGGPAQEAFFDFLYDHYGKDFLTKLKAQNPKVYPSSVPGLQALAAGEGTVLFPSPPGGDADLVKSGAPLKNIVPAATSGFDQYVAVSRNAPHPDAARLFANYLLSAEGQDDLTNGAAVSPMGSSAVPHSIAKPATLAFPDPAEVTARTAEINSLLGSQ